MSEIRLEITWPAGKSLSSARGINEPTYWASSTSLSGVSWARIRVGTLTDGRIDRTSVSYQFLVICRETSGVAVFRLGLA